MDIIDYNLDGLSNLWQVENIVRANGATKAGAWRRRRGIPELGLYESRNRLLYRNCIPR
jgi:hypothetical protein